MSRKVVYCSQNTQHRASHYKRLSKKLSSFPSTGSSLLEKSSNSEIFWNRVLSFLLKTKQHQFFPNSFDRVAVLPGCSLVTLHTRDNRKPRFKTPSNKGGVYSGAHLISTSRRLTQPAHDNRFCPHPHAPLAHLPCSTRNPKTPPGPQWARRNCHSSMIRLFIWEGGGLSSRPRYYECLI